MESRKDIAAEKKASFKFNCAQSVLTTYGDLTGLDEATAMSMTDGFAAGMTNMEGTCGALIGAGHEHDRRLCCRNDQYGGHLRCADWCRHGSRTGQ